MGLSGGADSASNAITFTPFSQCSTRRPFTTIAPWLYSPSGFGTASRGAI